MTLIVCAKYVFRKKHFLNFNYHRNKNVLKILLIQIPQKFYCFEDY